VIVLAFVASCCCKASIEVINSKLL